MTQNQDEIRDINAFHLDKKVIWIWSLNTVVPSLIILIFILAVSFAFTGNILGMASSELPLWVFGALLLVNIVYIVWLHLEYKYFIYYFTTSSVIIKKGVINTERHVIPYERIQDIRISRSILERLLNLASIKIETAAYGSHITKQLIPSVSSYRSIVNHLIEKRKKMATKIQKDKLTEDQQMVVLLTELLAEVKGLKNVLSKERDTKEPFKGRKL